VFAAHRVLLGREHKVCEVDARGKRSPHLVRHVGRVHCGQSILGFELLELLNVCHVLHEYQECILSFVMKLLHTLLQVHAIFCIFERNRNGIVFFARYQNIMVREQAFILKLFELAVNLRLRLLLRQLGILLFGFAADHVIGDNLENAVFAERRVVVQQHEVFDHLALNEKHLPGEFVKFNYHDFAVKHVNDLHSVLLLLLQQQAIREQVKLGV